MLGPLHALSETPARSALLAALRRVYLLGVLVLAVPGLLIGVPLGLSLRPQAGAPEQAQSVLLGLGLAALLSATLALTLAHRKARPALPGTPEGRSLAVQAAIQAAGAPGAPLLMALAMLGTPTTFLALLALALLALAAGWGSLSLWARRAGMPDGMNAGASAL